MSMAAAEADALHGGIVEVRRSGLRRRMSGNYKKGERSNRCGMVIPMTTMA